MRMSSALSVLLIIATNALANKTDIKKVKKEINLIDSKFPELQALSARAGASDDKEVKRAKKSTTTTFCVEIRPSGPFQKPFQVCEPAEPEKPQPQPQPGPAYSVPAATAYYPASSYGTPQEQPKPEAYKPPSQPKTGAVYSAPMKTYPAPTTPAPKPYPAHGMSYASYRSKNEEIGAEEHTGHLMRMTQASAEDDDNFESSLMSNQQMRSASYGLASYGTPSYGAPAAYVPVIPKKPSARHRNHNGLVITCQPNLAGYAHNVPSSLYHPPAVPNYSYRSSSPRNYGGRYGRYQTQSHAYGNYQQPPQRPDGYKYSSVVHQQQSTISSAPSKPVSVQQYSSAYNQQAYVPQEPAYAPPAYKPPPTPVYNPPPHVQPPPSYPSYSQPPTQNALLVQPPAAAYAPQALPGQPQSYGPYSQNYIPAPPAPVPAAAPPSPSGPTAPVYSQSQTFSSSPPVPAPEPQVQPYVPPGTYRSAGEESKIEEREKHTLRKMEEMSHHRSATAQWDNVISTDKLKSSKNEERVESPQPGWSMKMGESDKADGTKTESDRLEKDLKDKNEV